MGSVRCPFCGVYSRIDGADFDRAGRCPCGARYIVEPQTILDDEFGVIGPAEGKSVPFIDDDGSNYSATFF